jgi:hypothetical protein
MKYTKRRLSVSTAHGYSTPSSRPTTRPHCSSRCCLSTRAPCWRPAQGLTALLHRSAVHPLHIHFVADSLTYSVSLFVY